MENGYIEANDQELYYEIHGAGEPLLLIMVNRISRCMIIS
jgi:hypothetical protein